MKKELFSINLKESYKPKNFLDLYTPREVTFKNSQVIVIPYGYEGTVTFGQGTYLGPKRIIEASWQVELFEAELEDDIQNHIKIWTIPEPPIPTSPLKAIKYLKNIVKEVIVTKKLPAVIGGEHLISYGIAQALNDHYENISILIFDSHMDLIDRYSRKKLTHASWLRHSLKLPNIKQVALVGIQSYNLKEWRYWKRYPKKIKVFKTSDKSHWNITELVNFLTKNVYLSFDIDVFDSAVMPSTGTPEPAGLHWEEVINIIRQILPKKNVIGLDLVELAPIERFIASDFLAAKLLAKIILYSSVFYRNKKDI
ncbi:MAG: agmatinase [Flavobacterium sp.]|nr:agmatinase [Flavobacterium sp.]